MRDAASAAAPLPPSVPQPLPLQRTSPLLETEGDVPYNLLTFGNTVRFAFNSTVSAAELDHPSVASTPQLRVRLESSARERVASGSRQVVVSTTLSAAGGAVAFVVGSGIGSNSDWVGRQLRLVVDDSGTELLQPSALFTMTDGTRRGPTVGVPACGL